MRKWLPLLFLLAIPMTAQVSELDSLKNELARIQAKLDSTQNRLDSLVRTNNPIDLGNKILQAYRDGATHGEKTMKFVGWILAVVAGIIATLGTFGVFQIVRIDKVTKYIKEKMLEMRETVTLAQKGFKTVQTAFGTLERLFDKKANSIENIENEARSHLDSIIGIRDEVEALRDELKTLDKKVDSIDHTNRAYNFFNRKKYAEALKNIDTAIVEDVTDYEAHEFRATVLLTWGAELEGEEAHKKYEQAKKSAEKAIELSKGKEGHYNLACAQTRLGELKEALDSLVLCKQKGEELYYTDTWQDPDLEPLRKKYLKEFEKIVGPPPEGKPKPKGKTTKKK